MKTYIVDHFDKVGNGTIRALLRAGSSGHQRLHPNPRGPTIVFPEPQSFRSNRARRKTSTRGAQPLRRVRLRPWEEDRSDVVTILDRSRR